MTKGKVFLDDEKVPSWWLKGVEYAPVVGMAYRGTDGQWHTPTIDALTGEIDWRVVNRRERRNAWRRNV